MSNLYFYIIRITDPSKTALGKKLFKEETLGRGLRMTPFFFKKILISGYLPTTKSNLVKTTK